MILDLIKIRRDLHQIPEIGLERFETQAYLLERESQRDHSGQGLCRGNGLGGPGSWFIYMGLHLKNYRLADGYRWFTYCGTNGP